MEMSKERMLEVLRNVLHKAEPAKVLEKKIVDDSVVWSLAKCQLVAHI